MRRENVTSGVGTAAVVRCSRVNVADQRSNSSSRRDVRTTRPDVFQIDPANTEQSDRFNAVGLTLVGSSKNDCHEATSAV